VEVVLAHQVRFYCKIVGALTLKSFPFILRSWDVKSYESVDPTDAFGQSTRVYVNKNKIVKIEPQFCDKTLHIWLTDKGRLFFDSIFGAALNGTTESNKTSMKTVTQWGNLFKNLNKTFYVSNICNFKHAKRYFFLIIFENVSIEILNFLSLVSQINSFIKVKRAENSRVNPNLEANFQINSATSLTKLSASSLCLLVGVNPRYEGSYLNLKLRQRYLKGNFKLLVLGPLLDLTFPVTFLGSSVYSLKSISEGNHVLCKDIINSENPMFVTNTETFKHSNIQEFFTNFKVLNHSNTLNEIWNGSNILNSSLYETGFYTLSRFSSLTFKDLISFSSFYALNVDLKNVSSIKIVTESRLLKFKNPTKTFPAKIFLNHNFNPSAPNVSKFLAFKKYLYLPSSTFFETQETFVNAEGFRKIGSKFIFKKNTKSDWQLLRKFVQNFILSDNLGSVKDNQILFYGNASLFDFKNFISFHFQASQNLTNLNEFVSTTNRKFVIYKNFYVFKSLTLKLFKTKLKYWLDDFYTGGKDTFCQNSLTLTRCSANYRLQVTTFF
jgi:hypothetical protein